LKKNKKIKIKIKRGMKRMPKKPPSSLFIHNIYELLVNAEQNKRRRS
jgi:hypothetical protein